MSGPDRSRLIRLSFALSLLSCFPLAVGCGSEEPSTGSGRSGVGSADDDDEDEDEEDAEDEDAEDDDSDSKPASGGRDAGRRDSGSASGSADAGKKPDAGTGSGGGSSSSSDSTWCDAVAVLEDACGDCHGAVPSAGAPMPLVTFEDLMAEAPVTEGKKVYEVVLSRMKDTRKPMPPNGQLSADKIAAIDAWIKAGAEAGDEKCAAKSNEGPKTEAKWPPDGCTDIYELKAGNGQNVMVPAGQETHPQFPIDAPWGTKKVQALGFRPITDNAKVLHHWILYNGANFLTGWAPGQDDADKKPLPPNVGVYLPSGPGSMRLDMHYNNLTGTAAEPDQSGVEVCVTEDLREFSSTTYMGFVGIPLLPAGTETDTVGTCNVSISQPVFLLSESPHAHKLATHMKFEVVRGSERFVLRDEPFAFDAQVSKALPEPFELKNGDQVITTCHFKNDTNAFVTFGEDTGSEMCFNFATYYPMGALSCGGGFGGGGGTGAGGAAGGLGGLFGL